MPDSIRLNSIAVKNQKAILNYVFKYSSKINSIKSKSVVSAGNLAASVASGKFTNGKLLNLTINIVRR